MENNTQAARTPIKDIAQHAQDHYEWASKELCYWNSVIPQAIDIWLWFHQANKNIFVKLFNLKITIFIHIGEGRKYGKQS